MIKIKLRTTKTPSQISANGKLGNFTRYKLTPDNPQITIVNARIFCSFFIGDYTRILSGCYLGEIIYSLGNIGFLPTL